jgi:hypothetical protein
MVVFCCRAATRYLLADGDVCWTALFSLERIRVGCLKRRGATAGYQQDEKHHQANEEEYFGDSGGGPGDPGKPEYPSDDGD